MAVSGSFVPKSPLCCWSGQEYIVTHGEPLLSLTATMLECR